MKTKDILDVMFIYGLALMFFIGCSSKNNNNEPTPAAPVYVDPNHNGGYYPTVSGCQDCTGFTPVSLLNPAPARSESGSSGFPLQIEWDLLGAVEGIYSNCSKPYSCYSGPLVARGVLNLPTTVRSYYGALCEIPAGTYNFETLFRGNASNASMGVFSIRELQAVGPVTFRFSLANNVIYNSSGGSAGSDRIYGSILITGVNGASCTNFGVGFN